MLPRSLVATLLTIVLTFPTGQGRAEDVVKVGIVMPMTGSFAAAGRQVLAGIRLFTLQHGDSVAGKKIQLIVRDDASIPDQSKRVAQELIITDQVSVIGAGPTPNALAIAPLSREARIPLVLMISGTSFVTEASPYIVRTSFTLGQQSGIIAEWAVKNGSGRAVVVHSDFAPGTEASRVFVDRFISGEDKFLKPSRCHWGIRISRPSFSSHGTSIRIRCSYSSRRTDNREFSQGSSSSVASTRLVSN
jgi:branched-chain amino acid transport system substrate-binding protein